MKKKNKKKKEKSKKTESELLKKCYQKEFTSIFFHFFFLQYLVSEVRTGERKCQQHIRGALGSLQTFFVFWSEKFLFDISISGGLTG